MTQRRFTRAILLGALAFGCMQSRAEEAESTPKSELVKSLEAIFYDDDFAKVPQKDFAAVDYGAKADGKTVCTKEISKILLQEQGFSQKPCRNSLLSANRKLCFIEVASCRRPTVGRGSPPAR